MTETALDHLHTLSYSPFILMPILQKFYANYPIMPNSILLAYLVLPLTLLPRSKGYLATKRSGRTIYSLADYRYSGDKGKFFEVPVFAEIASAFDDYRSLTNLVLHQLIAQDLLILNDDLSIQASEDQLLTPIKDIQKSVEAATALADILSGFTISAIYRHFGIYKL